MRGEKCDYLHIFDPDRMPECSVWNRFSRCNDPDCSFKHIAHEDRPECPKYKLGFCRDGPRCKMRHERLPPSALPELLPDWYLAVLVTNAHLVPKLGDMSLELLGKSAADFKAAYGTSTIPGLPKPENGSCKYYVVRSFTVENIQISFAKGIWATTKGNAARLWQDLKKVDHVIILFSANDSRHFQGYGKMIAPPDPNLCPGAWGAVPGALSANFKVHWIKAANLPFGSTDHIPNPLNENLPLRKSRDGQELPREIGETLCGLLWSQPDANLLKGSHMEFEAPQKWDIGEIENSKKNANQRNPGTGANRTFNDTISAIEKVKEMKEERPDPRQSPPSWTQSPPRRRSPQRSGPGWQLPPASYPKPGDWHHAGAPGVHMYHAGYERSGYPSYPAAHGVPPPPALQDARPKEKKEKKKEKKEKKDKAPKRSSLDGQEGLPKEPKQKKDKEKKKDKKRDRDGAMEEPAKRHRPD